MEYSFAPMEGITGYLFRQCHHAVFPGVDAYYLPFAAPNANRCFSPKELRDVLPENNAGMHAVPQLLTARAEDCVRAIRELADMGYTEVNLNFGCPSQTVVTKGKGAGMLRDPAVMDRFLDEVFRDTPIAVSVKCRLGISDPAEFDPLLAVFNRYPLVKLILHPRVQKDFYKHPVRPDAFAAAHAACRCPMVYNGGLLTAADCRETEAAYPDLAGLMIGHGLLRDPGLVTQLKTGRPTTQDQVQDFHDRYYRVWGAYAQGDKQLLCKMKELWAELIQSFDDDGTYAKRIRKCTRAGEYEDAVRGLFRDRTFRPKGENP